MSAHAHRDTDATATPPRMRHLFFDDHMPALGEKALCGVPCRRPEGAREVPLTEPVTIDCVVCFDLAKSRELLG